MSTKENVVNYNGSLNYSTEEQVVGTWIDGKPLYQKTTYLPGPYSGSVDGIDIGYDSNTMNMVDISIIAREDSYNSIRLLPDKDYNVFIEMYSPASAIGKLSLRLSSGSLKNLYVTFRYTKTTD